MTLNALRWVAKRAYLELLRHLPDRFAIGVDYFRVFGRIPNLTNPERFSEKLQHLKLRVRDERMPALVDKVRAKEFVSAKLGEKWVIPTLWHDEHVTEDVLREIPKPAVVKATHSSSQLLFLHANTNVPAAARAANGWLTYDHHVMHREWAYGKVRREILIEPFIGEGEAQPPEDYKFWVFDGAVRFVQVDINRFKGHRRLFYTPAWKRLDLKMNYPAASTGARRPQHLDEMLQAARALANGFRFARIDLYDTPAGPLFGEITFAPEAGLCRFNPPAFDLTLGESWVYPNAAQETAHARSFSDAFLLNGAGKP